MLLCSVIVTASLLRVLPSLLGFLRSFAAPRPIYNADCSRQCISSQNNFQLVPPPPPSRTRSHSGGSLDDLSSYPSLQKVFVRVHSPPPSLPPPPPRFGHFSLWPIINERKHIINIAARRSLIPACMECLSLGYVGAKETQSEIRCVSYFFIHENKMNECLNRIS